MSTNYTVKQGDHMAKLAKQFGFPDYHIIWDDPQNADLKQLRQNPNVLYPGDTVFIRDKELRQETRPTDNRHKFVAKKPTLKLRLLVEDQYEEPVANAACVLAIGSDSRHITTDGDGKIEQDIPADAENATLVIQDPQTPLNTIQLPIAIGHVDPVEEFSGQASRLINLGYLAVKPANEQSDDFESAVEEFQCENALTVDGICGADTQAKLKQVHGC